MTYWTTDFFKLHERHFLFLEGTECVVESCIEANVPRLVFTSTIDVVIGREEIKDGDESLPYPETFLFPGYPDTKMRAEKCVLGANGRTLKNGQFKSSS